MITQSGAIKTEFTDFTGMQKKYHATLKTVSIILLVIGSLGLVAYIAVSTVLDTTYENAPAWCDAMLIFAVPFAFGLVLIIIIQAQQKQARKNVGAVNIYEFFSDCIIIRGGRAGLQTGVFRAEYAQVTKVKEVGNYLIFYYAANVSLFPLDKTQLTEEELNTIKALLRAPVQEGAQTLELPAFSQTQQELSVN